MIFLLRRATFFALVLASLLAAPRESRAQLADGAHIAVGTRVRVRMRDGTQALWRFEGASPDSLTLRRRVHGSDVGLSIPWSDAERLDTMVVGPASGRRMIAAGAAGGLFALLAVWFGSGLSGSKHEHDDCPGCGIILAAPKIIYAGIFAGATLGYFQRDRYWSAAWRAPAPADH